MTDLATFLAFLAAVSLLTATPGVDTAMVLRAAAVDGRGTAARASLGIALGCLVWGAAVSLGLGALLRASELAYTLLKLAGALYLGWLGAKLLLYPRRSLDTAPADDTGAAGQGAFGRGFLTNMLNPKVGVFYVTFLPQFVPAGASVASYSFFLALIHILISCAWFALLIAATVPLGRVLRRPSAMALLDRLTGVIFIGFGLKLAASSTR